MAHRITIKEACALAGVSRRTLYRDMDAGNLSYQIGPRNRRYFDIAELQRVYGDLQGIGDATEPDPDTPTPSETRQLLEAIHGLTEQVATLARNQAQMMEGLAQVRREVDQVKQLPAPTFQGAVSARTLGQDIAEAGEEADDPHGLHDIVRAMREREEQERQGGLH